MEGESNWSVAVEDLVDGGDVEGAISLLESVISKLESGPSSSPSDLELASALGDLANLYSSRGFSLKADELQTHAFLIKQAVRQHIRPPGDSDTVRKKDQEGNRVSPSDAASPSDAYAAANASVSSDDDWEAIADREPGELFSPQNEGGAIKVEEGAVKVSHEDTKVQTPKRRGRGEFLYRKNVLYSDKKLDIARDNESEDEAPSHSSEENTEIRNSRFGTNHVLVLDGFPPSTKTADLEKYFVNYSDSGVAIRWVHDTVALAVFRNPSIASEAVNSVSCPFMVRRLNENDVLLTSISTQDLEPPYPRPKTSARTAQRLIAQGIGQKLPTTFRSSDLKKQEEDRRNRIVTRQTLRDEAWGAD
ncbi:R3H and coiled-coil domain-containing protein 1 [Telopea speciosissima]|uniref:R3H and coiled-coil domain-containing protein 1 n=1 Tax=Telopea speciosissima TaxID=54955 RepID=UPI001CC78C2B|nr:R3H and coiled-coil domain-containing protein 1 [Telopea speciosissima]